MKKETWIVKKGETLTKDLGDNLLVVHTESLHRTPWQLFKASAAITAGASWVLGMILFASRSLEYIKTFF